MTDPDLFAVSSLAPLVAAPSDAVLARARVVAGIEPGTTDLLATGSPSVPVEPITLTPRRPRRTRRDRRRMLSLTVALASTGVAAATVGAVVIADRSHHSALTLPAAPLTPSPASVSSDRPSGLVTPTDAQLGSAEWFHESTTKRTGSCPGVRQVWFSFSGKGGIYRLEEGTRQNPCDPVDLPAAGPYFAEQPSSLSGLTGFAPTDKQLIRTLTDNEHLADGATPAEQYVNIIGESLTETPLPSSLRVRLLSLMAKAPGVTSVDGADSLGRPVRWLSAPSYGDARQWYGFDEETYWLIATSNSPAAVNGQPSGLEGIVTAIDTTPPAAISETEAEAHPSPGLTPSPCPIDFTTSTGTCSIVTPLIAANRPAASATPSSS